MESLKLIHMNDVTIDIWNWVTNKDSWIYVTHITGIENIEVDEESTPKWMLNKENFKEI